MSARLRCARGHFLPATTRPVGDPEDWDDSCRCVLTRRPRKRRSRSYASSGRGDLWGQGLSPAQVRSMTTVPLTGSYL